MPIFASMRFASFAIVLAGVVPMQPLGAGKIEIGFVQRQRFDQRRQLAHQRAHFARRTAAYFAMLGLMMTACGQSLRAWNIGMAERTPEMRAM